MIIAPLLDGGVMSRVSVWLYSQHSATTNPDITETVVYVNIREISGEKIFDGRKENKRKKGNETQIA